MSDIVIHNNWDFLKQYTDARIALGRTGHSVPTKALLEFQLAHAQAKDAVYSELDVAKLISDIKTLGISTLSLKSRVRDRNEYLKRPDLGRRLNEESIIRIDEWTTKDVEFETPKAFDINFCVVDGLSSTAIHTNLMPFLENFIPLAKNENWSLSPICIVEQGRVAIGDDICSRLKAQITVVLIGERPGLSSPDSMGIYLTYMPQVGFTDERRNCISNIRPKGLTYEKAANALYYLIKAAKMLKLSGVELKEDVLLPPSN